MFRDILLDIPKRLLGFPQTPDCPLTRSVEHTLRCGFMLRMTSRGKDWCYNVEGLAAKRRKGAVPCSERSNASGLDIWMSGPSPRRARFIHDCRTCIEVRHFLLTLRMDPAAGIIRHQVGAYSSFLAFRMFPPRFIRALPQAMPSPYTRATITCIKGTQPGR